MRTLLAALDPARYKPSGVAIAYPQNRAPEMVRAMAAICPVGFGLEAVDRLYRESDIVLVWGVPNWDQRIPVRPRSSKVALVSHGIGPWTEPVVANPDSADALLAVSHAAIRPYPERVRDHVRVMPNGIDPHRLVPSPGAVEAIHQQLDVKQSERIVLYMGRMADEKNPTAFVAAASLAEQLQPGQWRFVIVGDGPGDKATRKLASEIAPKLVFAGCVQNVGDWLAAADTLVLPSHEEADSLALLESWHAGIPVVATPVGRLSDPNYAMLARLVSPNPTASEILAALNLDRIDPAGTRARTVQARDVALANHTDAAMAARYMGLFDNLLETRCVHRIDSWSCSERILKCGKGFGVDGIIEESTCEGCRLKRH